MHTSIRRRRPSPWNTERRGSHVTTEVPPRRDRIFSFVAWEAVGGAHQPEDDAEVELIFASRPLRLLCEDEAEARRALPAQTVIELHARLADMDAAQSMSDVVFGEPELNAMPPGRVRFRLVGGYELVCVGNHRSPALTADGGVDFDRVRRLKIQKIGEVEP